MKRIVIVLSLLAFLVALPASASADDSYGKRHKAEGRLLGNMNGTYIGFDLKGKKRITAIGMSVPVACVDMPLAMPAPLPSRKLKVKIAKDGRFSHQYRPRMFDTRWNIKFSGRLKGKKLTGTLKVSANVSYNGRCTSGVVDFKARKGRIVQAPEVTTPVSAPPIPVPLDEGGAR